MNKHTNPTIVKRPKKTHRDRGTEIGSVLVILLVLFITACVVIGGGIYFVRQNLNGGKNTTQKVGDTITITPQKLDKTQLKALIDNTESINTETYTDESVNELKAAVEKGNTLLRGVPGQDAIEETYMEIVNAIQGLTKKDTQ